MKKITIYRFCLSFLLLSASSAFTQDVPIPDALFKSFLVGDPAINTNGDTEIQVSEANSYTGPIYLSSSMVTDMTGLEYFTSITILQCSHNTLSSINLTGNTALISLDCYDNNLTSLDLSHNLNLQHARFFLNNITNMDISLNTALTYFDCAANQLTSLDVSTNTALTSIDCFGNNLTSLDVSNNIALIHLLCDGNNLTTLNLKNGHNLLIDPAQIAISYNPDLTCVLVDDPIYSTVNWLIKDPTSFYSADCSAEILEQHNSEEISIFPNPFTNSFTLKTTEKISSIEINSLSGASISTNEYIGNSKTIITDNLPEGFYFCKIYFESGNIRVVKIFKKS